MLQKPNNKVGDAVTEWILSLVCGTTELVRRSETSHGQVSVWHSPDRSATDSTTPEGSKAGLLKRTAVNESAPGANCATCVLRV